MKILNPNNTSHSIVIEPRFYVTSELTLLLKNKDTGVSSDISNTYSYSNNVLTIVFDFDILEAERYDLTIKEGVKILYRGKIYCSSQDPQNYRLTKDKYIHV